MKKTALFTQLSSQEITSLFIIYKKLNPEKRDRYHTLTIGDLINTVDNLLFREACVLKKPSLNPSKLEAFITGLDDLYRGILKQLEITNIEEVITILNTLE